MCLKCLCIKTVMLYRVAITMTVSAFWHGVHPGYYLSFLTVPISLMAEDLMAAAFRSDKDPTQQKIYDWVAFFFRGRAFDYMCMGFLLLSYHDTVRYWSSIYYFTHIYIVIFIIIGYVCKPKRTKKPAEAVNNTTPVLSKEIKKD